MPLCHPLILLHSSAATPLTIFGSACVLWLRGDVGNTTTWTDQSASAANATWSASPTATTLGPNAQPAWNVSSGQHADNTTNSLVTAGSTFTVLAVAKTLTVLGGAVFCVRRTTEFNASIAVTSGGLTYYYTASAVNDNVGSDLSTTLQAANGFLAQWSYTGTSAVPAFRLNRTNRTSGATNQVLESGSTGFQVGLDSTAAQPWNGILGEVVVVNRAITGTEQTNYENYVSSYWGI